MNTNLQKKRQRLETNGNCSTAKKPMRQSLPSSCSTAPAPAVRQSLPSSCSTVKPMRQSLPSSCSTAPAVRQSLPSSFGTNGNGTISNRRNDLDELKLKMAALEAKVERLEADRNCCAKLEIKIRDMREEFTKELTSVEDHFQKEIDDLTACNRKFSAINKTLIEENRTFGEKLKDAERKLDATIQDNQHKMEETFAKQITAVNAEQQKQKQELEEAVLLRILEDVERKAEMHKNELTKKMEQFETEFGKEFVLFQKQQETNLEEMKEENKAFGEKLKDVEQKVDATIQSNQQKMEETFANQIATINAEQQKQKQDLEEAVLLRILEEAERKAEMHKNELTKKMEQFETEFGKEFVLFQKQQETNLEEMKEENKAFGEKLKDVEQKLDSIIQDNHQIMEEIFAKQIAALNAERQKQKQDFEEAVLLRILEEAEKKAEMHKNELTKKMEQFETEFGKEFVLFEEQQETNLDEMKEENKAFGEKLKEETEEKVEAAKNELKATIQANQQKMDEFIAKQMMVLRQEQPLQPEQKQPGTITISSSSCCGFDQMKLNFVWNTFVKGKKVVNSKGNRWKGDTDKKAAICSPDGLHVYSTMHRRNLYAEKGFDISGQLCRTDHFPGTVVHYYEVTPTSSSKLWKFDAGFSAGAVPGGECVGWPQNTYAIPIGCAFCNLAGKNHDFEPIGTMEPPKWKVRGNVIGCGLLLNSLNKLAIFFTLNGILLGKQIPINPTENSLFPTVTMWNSSLDANFGDNPAKPFKFDIDKCPGLIFE